MTESRTQSTSEVEKVLLRPWVRQGKKVSFQDTDIKVYSPVPSKTLGKDDTKEVSFKKMDETVDKSISFKIFDKWVKARHDTVLKNALSFTSGEKSTLEKEKDSPEVQPQLHRARHLGDQKHQ